MENVHKCPRCNHQTIGTHTNGSPVICPRCKREGVIVQMTEERNQVNENLGDGLFRRRKLTEST